MPKKLLALAVVEKDVENAYREAIRKARPKAKITSPHHTDGYAQWDSVRLLLEAKYNQDFKDRIPVCNTLGQCLLYIKKFEASGDPLPNVILVGDKNECFVLATNAVRGFLDLPIDWSVAPSTGNPELMRALVEGLNILPYVYDVDGNFKFSTVLDKVETLAAGEQASVRANQINIGAIFTYWRDRVFNDKKLTAVEQVDVFLRCLFQPGDVYPHPTKRGVLVVPTYPGGVLINVEQYRSFFDHFEQGYKPSEIEAFYAIKDRLVEDDARRRQGAFFTPDLWVAEAHKVISEALGDGWRDECVVWDPAAGTANLTRDYRFSDLIISTAERPDVQVIKEQDYNSGASVFHYDFLNPGAESPFFEPEDGANVIPAGVDRRLREAAKAGKRLVFFMNPPYGTANNAGTKAGDHKAGIAKTLVNGEMKAAKMGACSQQLYAQFMFQCSKVAEQYGFEQHTVALFSMSKFMSSGSYRKFRDWWYGRYEAKGAFMFQASHFADVKGSWGISFTVWNSPGSTASNVAIPCTLKDEPKGIFAVADIDTKAIYNSDGWEASKWVREPIKGTKGEDAPQMSSGLKVKEGPGCHGRLNSGVISYMTNVANCLYKSGTDVFFTSSCSSMAHGLSILPTNWRRAIALYGARKLVKDHWTIHEDEYLRPTPSEAYEQWVDDCHVYALLETKNNCTAMRDVVYKGKTWQISNHFFWMTHSEALKALDTARTPSLYRDCKQHPAGYVVPKQADGFGLVPTESWEEAGDPYMAHVLPSLNLSPEARLVLDKLKALWIKSLPMRESYAAGKPDLHLTAWDAGVYQLKHLWRDLFPDEWKDLQASYRALADKLQPGVYDHGFLLR